MSDVLLETDSRGRISIGRLNTGHDRFLAHTEPDGSIVLTPAVVVPAHQAALMARPDVVDQIRRARANPDALVRRLLPSTDA